ncbi:MAG: biotin--[acetyl-CoA-carboxylase] ligase [Ruminococcaceae bacterium]|nr:biotin--[acetyl-CoA-carboxylase] ligase [Oscillospiraceae bacterium]
MIDSVLKYLPHNHPWADKIHYFDCVESTNTLAKDMARAGAPHGTVLIADRQTAGRGRLGRSFLSPGGMGIYMSVILRYHCTPEELMHLTCACGVHVCNGIEAVLQLRPGIKWINDLVCGQRKLAGILTELIITCSEVCAIVGIGLNCSQKTDDFDPQIRSLATSLAMITGQQPDRSQLIAGILQELLLMDRRLLSEKEALMAAYRTDCITIGQSVCVVQNESARHGKALDVLPDGALLVQFDDGSRRAVNSGEVSIRGMYGYI